MTHISVMIPVYNHAHFIGRTIECVLNQEFQDIDLVVVDDVSTDNTVDVVNGYCRLDSRVRLVVNERNLGLTRNWNKCLALATGPLVQIMQSDDLIDSNYLALVSKTFTENSRLGFVAASCRYIDPEDIVFHPGAPIPACLFRAGDEAVLAILTVGFPHVSSIVMRKQCYERLGGYNENIWSGPDVEMDARLASRYDYYHFGDVHTSFRRHGSNSGQMEFLRKEFLSNYTQTMSKAWSYLSLEGRRRLGVDDLDTFVAHNAAQTALTGATLMIGYGRPDLSRFYLKEALRLNPRSWRLRQFWKVCVLLLAPGIGRRIMESRMRISDVDRARAREVETSLKSIGGGKR